MMRIALLAASAVLVFSQGVAAQTPSVEKQQVQAVIDAYNVAYADLLGVSVPEAVAYQGKVAEALALNASLRSRADYLGFRIAPGAVFSATFQFTGDGRAALAGLTADPAFATRQVQFAPSAVQQALDAVTAALRSLTQGHTLYFDDRTETLKLHVFPGSPARTLLSTLRLTIPIEIVEDGMVAQVTADLEGGRPVTSSTENLTSGLSVSHTDGRRGITTAGHAPNSGVAFEGTIIPYAGELYGTRDLQWHSGSGHTYTPHVWVGTGYLTIQQTGALGSGVPVCMEGNVNMNRCGRTDQTNVGGTDNLGKSFSNAVSFKRDDNSRMVSKGDSGAPMVTADGGVGIAYGTQFAGFDAINSSEFRGGLYVKAGDFSLMGVSVQTRPPF